MINGILPMLPIKPERTSIQVRIGWEQVICGALISGEKRLLKETLHYTAPKFLKQIFLFLIKQRKKETFSNIIPFL